MRNSPHTLTVHPIQKDIFILCDDRDEVELRTPSSNAITRRKRQLLLVENPESTSRLLRNIFLHLVRYTGSSCVRYVAGEVGKAERTVEHAKVEEDDT
jgi:hypothetical protein